MWYYRRRLSVHPIESNVTFDGQRLKIAANGCVLTPVDDALALKMRRAPHVFMFKPAAPIDAPAPVAEPVQADEPAPAVEAEKVDISSANDDNVKTKRARKRRKVQG